MKFALLRRSLDRVTQDHRYARAFVSDCEVLGARPQSIEVLDEQLHDVARAVQVPDESTRALAMTKLAREVGDAAISRATAKAFDVGGLYDAMWKFDRESHLLAQNPYVFGVAVPPEIAAILTRIHYRR